MEPPYQGVLLCKVLISLTYPHIKTYHVFTICVHSIACTRPQRDCCLTGLMKWRA